MDEIAWHDPPRENPLEINCRWCGAPASDAISRREDGELIFQCIACNFAFAAPRREVAAIYRSREYIVGSKLNPTEGYSHYFKTSPAHFLPAVALAGLLIDGGFEGRIVDIGCATGVFLNLCRCLGWQTLGVEINPLCLRYLRQSGIPAFESLPQVERSRGLIFSIETVEHLPAPRHALTEMLRSEAATAIVVPRVDFSEPDWHGRNESFEHLSYFSEAFLRDRLPRDFPDRSWYFLFLPDLAYVIALPTPWDRLGRLLGSLSRVLAQRDSRTLLELMRCLDHPLEGLLAFAFYCRHIAPAEAAALLQDGADFLPRGEPLRSILAVCVLAFSGLDEPERICVELERLWRALPPSLARNRLVAEAASHLGTRRHTAISSNGRISVVVPAFNHASYICNALDSIRFPEKYEPEVVLVDDGSTDDTLLAGATALIRKGLNFAALAIANSGAHAALNLGMEVSTGDLIAFHNSDDVYHEERLIAVADLWASEGRPRAFAAATLCDSIVDGPRTPAVEEWELFKERAEDALRRGPPLNALLRCNPFITSGNLVISADLAREEGFRFVPFRYCHDYMAFFWLALRNSLRVIPRHLYSYRWHSTNTIAGGGVVVTLEANVVLQYASQFLPPTMHSLIQRENVFYDPQAFSGLSRSVLEIFDMPAPLPRPETAEEPTPTS